MRARRHDRTADPAVLASIAAGGAVGAVARHLLSATWPPMYDPWPWSTLLVNAGGCLLLGAMMAVLAELSAPHRLFRPFLGVGVLGGYTTFSTVSAETYDLLSAGDVLSAYAYVAGTAVLCLAATWSGLAGARALARRGVHASYDRGRRSHDRLRRKEAGDDMDRDRTAAHRHRRRG